LLALDRDPDHDGSPTWLELMTRTEPLVPGRSVLTHTYSPTTRQFTLVIPEYSEEIGDYYRISPDLQDSPDLASWAWTNGALGQAAALPGKPGWFSYTYTVSGLVGSPLAIAKYEVTNAEYAAFLNSVDRDGENARGLFDPLMASETAGGIELVDRGYVVKPGKANHPVNFVTHDSARRYCNWLHNGAHRDSDTETGAYDLTGDGPRLAGAEWFLPTFDEWYKAAYFVTSTGPAPAYAPIYTDYPTGATINRAPAPGNSRSANFGSASLLPVGSFPAAASVWGAFDLAGNIAEMLETPNSASVTLKGAAFSDSDATNAFRNAIDAQNKTTPTAHGGFRVATRP
jgi:formylglycine-generating enzyme required for sulfatase activity